MQTFISEIINSKVIDVQKNIQGNLRRFTNINIKGNHKKDLVKVIITYDYIFTPNSEFLEINHEDCEYNSWQITGSYDTHDEREININNNFCEIDKT